MMEDIYVITYGHDVTRPVGPFPSRDAALRWYFERHYPRDDYRPPAIELVKGPDEA